MGRKHVRKHGRRGGRRREAHNAASISSAEVERSTGLGGSPVCETNGTYFYLSVFAKCDPFVVHYAQPGGDLEAQHSLSETEVRSLAPRFHFFPAATVIGSIAFFFLSVTLWLLRLCLWYLQLLWRSILFWLFWLYYIFWLQPLACLQTQSGTSKTSKKSCK